METKSWWQSKTILAGIVVAVCSLLGLFGVGEAENIASEAAPIAETIIEIIALIGGIVAIVGRIVAEKKVV